MNWLVNGEPLLSIPKEKYGFIYLITYKSGMKYLGKRSFYSFKTLPPLKGTKRKRRVIKESKWKQYTGSSKLIPKGDKIVSKVIVCFGNGKQHLSYLEEKYLFKVDACINKEYYNGNIGSRYFDNVDRVVGEYLKYKGKIDE